ncbi:Phospholipase D delta [Diplonema papillatum]|nr:Phospholipase D delta [Diplonema papillatum]
MQRARFPCGAAFNTAPPIVWGEHLNEGRTVNSALYYPESKACADYVNTKSYKAWKDHAGDIVQKQECHLMKYPIVVNPDGSIHPIQECFPDAPGANIRGVESATIPDFMTS